MKVFPVVIADETYFDLFELFEKSIRKTGYPFEPTRFYVKPNTIFAGKQADFLKKCGVIQRSRPIGYGQWENWNCCEAYHAVLKDIANDPLIGDDDYIMDADADVVMVNAKVLEEIDGSDVVGLPLMENLWDVPAYNVKRWPPYSGSFVFMKGSCIRRMASVSNDHLQIIKKQMKDCGIVYLDDTFMSFLMLTLGVKAKHLDWGRTIMSNEEQVILGNVKSDSSIAHFVGDTGRWKTFLGVPVTGKRDIPRAIKESGVNWP